jgi:hypothetical protein
LDYEAAAIAKVLKVPLAWLFGDSAEVPPSPANIKELIVALVFFTLRKDVCLDRLSV